MMKPTFQPFLTRKNNSAFPVFFFLLAVLLLFNNTQAQEQRDDEVVRVNTDLIVLNVSVMDEKGKYVEGLTLNDFKIFEDDRQQKITTFSAEDTNFAAVILIDTSSSMESRITLARSAAIRFLDGLRGEDYVSVFNFDSVITKVQDFSTSRDLAPKGFKLQAKGMTVLYDAIVKACQELSTRPEKRRAIIVLSDGMDTKSGATMEKALNSAMAVDATLYTVDMSADGNSSRTSQQNAGILKSLADKTGGRFIATPGGPTMRDAFQSILEELSRQYTIGYQPSNTNYDGKWRALRVETTKLKTNARARKGYRAPKS